MNSICSLFVALFLFNTWLMIRPSNMITSRVAFGHRSHLVQSMHNYRLLIAGSFAGRYAWLFIGLHSLLWYANLELAPELSSTLSCTNMWKEPFPLLEAVLSRGRLWDVCSSSFLHGLILHPYLWDLLMKQICPPCFQVVAVPALWCCTPRYAASVLADFSLCSVYFPLRRLNCGSLSFALVLSTVSQLHNENVSRLQTELTSKETSGFFCLKTEWWTVCMWGFEFRLVYVRVCGSFSSPFRLRRKWYSCCLSIFPCPYTDICWMTLEA